MNSVLEQAIAAHQTGNLAAAETLYRRLLADDDGHFDALHMLGVLEAQRGNLEAAERNLRRARDIDPNVPPCIQNHANVLAKLKRYEEALSAYEHALVLAPRHPPLHSDRGSALLALDRPDEALASYDRALALAPHYAEAHYNRGCALRKLQRPVEALISFDRALAANPNHALAHLNRGDALYELERFPEALASYERAGAINPNSTTAHHHRGKALFELKRFDEALTSYDRALAVGPANAAALVDRALALQMLGRTADAMKACDRALALDPALPGAHQVRGNVLNALDRQEEAIAAFDRALALDPNLAEASTNKAMCLLTLGRFAEGWPLFDHRFEMRKFPPRPYPQARWEGQRLDGPLLVWAEQGLGDQILHAGMVPELAERTPSVVLEVEPRLVPLFARSFPGVQVVGQGPYPQLHAGPVAAQIALGSLGRHLRPDWESFPRRDRGYLTADPDRTRALRTQLAGDGRTVIGLSWISANPDVGRAKSARLHDFGPLLRLPNCRFIDLQYGDTLAERDSVERELGSRVERLDVDNTNDIDGLAALIAACDAVVTVSNTTAHLAGALGRTAWVLVPFGQARLWYWFKHATSPWYPRVELRRQGDGQSWGSLLGALATELQGFNART